MIGCTSESAMSVNPSAMRPSGPPRSPARSRRARRARHRARASRVRAPRATSPRGSRSARRLLRRRWRRRRIRPHRRPRRRERRFHLLPRVRPVRWMPARDTRRRARHRRRVGHHLVEDRAERVDIAAPIRVPVQLLRRHVRARPRAVGVPGSHDREPEVRQTFARPSLPTSTFSGLRSRCTRPGTRSHAQSIPREIPSASSIARAADSGRRRCARSDDPSAPSAGAMKSLITKT